MTRDEALARMEERTIPKARMKFILLGLFELMQFEFVVRLRGYGALARWIGDVRAGNNASLEEWVGAVDLAAIWYWHSPACLQRSTVLARLLRRAGIAAEVVVGVQQFPFRSHAWVEVDHTPANERRRVGEAYAEIDRWA